MAAAVTTAEWNLRIFIAFSFSWLRATRESARLPRNARACVWFRNAVSANVRTAKELGRRHRREP
jgi:hypothetical protein